MKENYALIIQYHICDFNGRDFTNSNRFFNMRDFWNFIERYYSEALSVEIESIEVDW